MLQKLRAIRPGTVWVVGDVMLDEFHWCHVHRISPEAPVPVCKVDRTTLVPGGAANVAVNIASLGSQAVLFGVVGKDSASEKLLHELHKRHIDTHAICHDPKRPTTLKSRIIAHNQQVARVDHEDPSPLCSAIQSQLLYKFHLMTEKPLAIVLSDYHKGTLSQPVIDAFIAYAHAHNVPLVVDPKGNDYSVYTGATVLTPNFLEFETAVHKKNLSEDAILKESLSMIKALNLEGLVITRSEKGMSIVQKNGHKTDIPTKATDVFDITGAGDTVIAVLSLALGNGWPLEDAAYLANEAAGIVVQKLGTASTSIQEIKQALK